MRRWALVSALLLAGCQTPLEQCLSRADAPAADLRAELAERRANLTRGYRLDRQLVPVLETRMCTLPGPVPGSVQGVPCPGWSQEWRETRAPIDPVVEAERIALIERQLARAQGQAETQAQACRAAYPPT